MMRALILLSLIASSCCAEDLYLGQSAAGSGNGSSCANQLAYTFFNSSGNWGAGAGKISPGDTVHLCGTITGSLNSTLLTFQASGTSGNPVKILFELSANLSSPAFHANGAINCNGKSFITIDGGTNGLIQNTANGDALANQIVTAGINSGSGVCPNMIVQNMTISNLYIKVQGNNTNTDDSAGINLFGDNSLITHNTIDHAATGIGSGNSSHHEISFNSFTFCQHCITDGTGGPTSAVDDIKIHDNDIGGGAYLWDQAANSYHHNGIIVVCETSANPCVTNALVYNNYVHGIWSLDGAGSHTTSAIFFDDYDTSQIQGYAFNNLINFPSPDVGVDNGYFTGGHQVSFFNNTVIAQTGATCMSMADFSTVVIKNNVFQNCGFGVYAPGTASGPLIADHNLYYQVSNWALNTGADNYSQWKSECSCDANSLNGSNPLLNSNGTLQTGSPAIALGANLTSLGISALLADKSGTSRPSSGSWDVGAFQFASALPGTPPSFAGSGIRGSGLR